MAYYLDTSAAVKLVVTERGSAALLRWLGAHEDAVVSSDLLRTELLRATRRGAPEQMPRARAVLDALTLVAMSREVFERAGELSPDHLRSLDALHLAAALEFGDELDGVITYDERLSEAAALLGMTVLAPA